ncbi:MAG: succinate--CoA ligase subunit alpha [Candidatus Ryanbacteria bacterium CG10_big_fil_rev_8_21_14_0_10_43_42]|uniref:Succinate--CoA ligase subunit alpha n=1 Tax=Candidatus Ryanbacteria bacterium CG10_big_fil_rev_8_21_14_0_10_43_42 TaxID=1974864 RepID=A0A2M8KXK0_9BACT|nr:MAG: succinate--CoA ligase subunit alpha [Candidatus Ryanbacteria bacterium CG10_big_fil_rev_8_21_14_0_10_43_42]
MAILVTEKTKVLIQGITGKEGLKALEGMRNYGTDVLAGVTPGKGGGYISNVPVYNTVREAMQDHPSINATLLVMPALAVKAAAYEAIQEKIPLLNILTEHVSVRDTALIIAQARKDGVNVIGPSSVGIISPGIGKMGSIGGENPGRMFRPGPVGIISKSGGMTSEIAITLNRSGLGQSTVLGIGGDQLIGFDFIDAMKLFEKDEKTHAIVIFGEVGGTYEEQLAEFIQKERFKKPIIAIIAGRFTSAFPSGTVFGHAGTIVMRNRGGYESKVSALQKAGVMVVNTLEEIPLLLKKKFYERMG